MLKKLGIKLPDEEAEKLPDMELFEQQFTQQTGLSYDDLKHNRVAIESLAAQVETLTKELKESKKETAEEQAKATQLISDLLKSNEEEKAARAAAVQELQKQAEAANMKKVDDYLNKLVDDQYIQPANEEAKKEIREKLLADFDGTTKLIGILPKPATTQSDTTQKSAQTNGESTFDTLTRTTMGSGADPAILKDVISNYQQV